MPSPKALNSGPQSGGKAGSPAGQPRWGANPAFPTTSWVWLSYDSRSNGFQRGFNAVSSSLSG
jgi:hypothetical protein